MPTSDLLTLAIYVAHQLGKTSVLRQNVAEWFLSLYCRISIPENLWRNDNQTDIFFLIKVSTTLHCLCKQRCYYCKICSVFEFWQLQTCPQMKLSNLPLFIPGEDTGHLVHLSSVVYIHSSLSHISSILILVSPNTITFMCHYLQKVRREFEPHNQTSFSCLTQILNNLRNYGRTFLSCALF